jgi:hypothetical protein
MFIILVLSIMLIIRSNDLGDGKIQECFHALHDKEMEVKNYREDLFKEFDKRSSKLLTEDKALFLRELAAFKVLIETQGKLIVDNQKKIMIRQR